MNKKMRLNKASILKHAKIRREKILNVKDMDHILSSEEQKKWDHEREMEKAVAELEESAKKSV